MNEGIEEIDGVEMYRIPDATSMQPFLMTIVSNSDLWMFISSAGGLTAGRVDNERCIFPYETDDRLNRANGSVGPATRLLIQDGHDELTWEPFSDTAPRTRHGLLKSLTGDAIVFEAEHLDLGLVARARWAPSERFGWVRTVSLTRNGGDRPMTIEVVDGLLEVMPWGISVAMQQQMSNLANAYRRSELADHDLGIFSLEASIVDHPDPAEALRATTVWSTGLVEADVGLDGGELRRVNRGAAFRPSSLHTGRPGSYLLNASIDIEPGGRHRWHVVADVAQSHADITRLQELFRSAGDLTQLVDDDIRRSSDELRRVVALADGVQQTASPVTDAHHFANTLFNVMRGGTFLHDDEIDAERFRSFVADRNRQVAERSVEWLGHLPATMRVGDLRARAADSGDANLVRLAHEYLPLAFSRRHGDPSRPWNHFAIRVQDDHGEPILSYQGNWRDIFQNWEALGRSFPEFLPSMIAKFLNASTADGFNPYRITSDGIDWEIPEPDDPWSGIGYWGDHQIVYLHRLLRTLQAHDPAWIGDSLDRPVHSFADVPYRLAPFAQIVRDPKSTLEYDPGAESEVAKRVAAIGADGRLLTDADGDIVHVTLLEKLLVPALAKVSNYVPRGGIWMNTQRPEWNDANNALVGAGLSMVTLAHLRAYLQMLDELIAPVDTDLAVSADVVTWLEAVTDVLERGRHLVGASSVDDVARASILRGVGEAFGDYRAVVYERGHAAPVPLEISTLRRFIDTTRRHLDDTLQSARRSDGLFESYNLIDFRDDGGAAITRLPVMLEGQVAAISSGLLSLPEVVELVDALYRSDLYRPDVDTFMLAPAIDRPAFMERNQVPPDRVASNPLLAAIMDAGSGTVIGRDSDGRYRFHPDFRNVADLRAALDDLEHTEFAPLVADHRRDTLVLFEEVFRHHEFTGRSSTMYGYEGIGSVYWHMVAKLLVAIQEYVVAPPASTNPSAISDLAERYERVRSGLGFNRTAAEYGAFPTDPYSHTPPHAGAQQPGMTGQVKEELLTRWAELGVVVRGGSITFDPVLVDQREFRRSPTAEARPASFTICQTPVTLHPADQPAIRVSRHDGTDERFAGSALDPASSRHIFGRTGTVARVDVEIPIVLG